MKKTETPEKAPTKNPSKAKTQAKKTNTPAASQEGQGKARRKPADPVAAEERKARKHKVKTIGEEEQAPIAPATPTESKAALENIPLKKRLRRRTFLAAMIPEKRREWRQAKNQRWRANSRGQQPRGHQAYILPPYSPQTLV